MPADLAAARTRESAADRAIPTLRIMEEMAEPRATFVSPSLRIVSVPPGISGSLPSGRLARAPSATD